MEFVGKVENEYGLILTRRELECIILAVGRSSRDDLEEEYKKCKPDLYKTFQSPMYCNPDSIFNELLDLANNT